MKKLLLLGVIALGCGTNENNIKPKVESLNVYDVVIKNEKPIMGKPLYKEAFEYNGDGSISQHFLYNEIGELRSREIYPTSFQDTTKTSYYDGNNVLQSNYRRVYDENNNKIEVYGYEAASGELLRIERFDYDSDDNIISKKVFTGDDQLYRHQKFEYDKYGNEIAVKIYNDKNQIIFEEEYDISTLDGKNNWIEKWGYQDGQPKSFRKRVLKY